MSAGRLFAEAFAQRARCSFREFSYSHHKVQAAPRETIQESDSLLQQETGFTLVEIVAAIAIMAVLMAISLGALSHYWARHAIDTAVTELTTEIREAQSLATSTGDTYRIDFSDPSPGDYTLKRRTGGEWVNVRAAQHLPSGVTFSATPLPSFGGDASLSFQARGTAESGQLTVTGRFGSSRVLTVDGETVNVT